MADTALDRMKVRKMMTDEEISRISNLIGKVKTGGVSFHKKLFERFSSEDKKLLRDELKLLKQLSRLYERQIKNWKEEK